MNMFRTLRRVRIRAGSTSRSLLKRITITTGAALFVLFMTSSCQHARVRFDGCSECRGAVEKYGDTVVTRTIPFYFWGLGPSKVTLRASDLCPDRKVVEIYERSTVSDGLWENLTLGLYAPKTVDVVCRK